MNQIILPVPPGHPGHPSTKTSRGWKVAFLIWNGLGLFFLIAALASGGSTMNDCVGEYADACQAGATIGSGIAVAGALFITVMGDGILGVAYAIFKKKQPTHIIVQG